MYYNNFNFYYGLCCIVPFGDFSKGLLYLDMEAELLQGDIAFLTSAHICHDNRGVVGARHNLVFYADATLFFPVKQ